MLITLMASTKNLRHKRKYTKGHITHMQSPIKTLNRIHVFLQIIYPVHAHEISSILIHLFGHLCNLRNIKVNPLTPRIWLLIIPSCCFKFSCKLVDRFEYSHYLFARYLMDISGRNFMLITSGSYIVEKNNHPYIYTKCAFYI